jgi:hypothetical protein
MRISNGTDIDVENSEEDVVVQVNLITLMVVRKDGA